jgi:hypothetical protein
VRFDADTDAMAVVFEHLSRAGGQQARRALKAAAPDDAGPPLAQIGAHLAAAKLALIHLASCADGHALCIVPAARVAPLQKLARTAKHTIEHLAPSRRPR